MSKQLDQRVEEAKAVIQETWGEFRAVARSGFDARGRGAVAVAIGPKIDWLVKGERYWNSDEIKKRLGSEAWVVMARIGQYNPEREICLCFIDLEGSEAQALILGEREDGSPWGRNFHNTAGQKPDEGKRVPPIVEKTLDSAAAQDFDSLMEAIEDKISRNGEKSLNPDEEAVWQILCLKGEVQNGGFDQFFFNCESNIQSTGEALKRTGLTKLRAVYEAACARFPGGLPEKGKALEQQFEELSHLDDVWGNDK